jgi:hypothetical protein
LYETEDEMAALEGVLERSMSKSGEHLSSLFGVGQWLSADQVAHHLQGLRAIALATVNSRLEPRVAPMEAVLVHARFYVAVESESSRVRQLTRRPAVSLTYTREDDVLITVHGNALIVHKGEPEFAGVGAEYHARYGGDLPDTVVFVRIEPTFIVAYALNPEMFPSA